MSASGVQPEHAAIRVEDDRVVIQDRSLGETRVNGEFVHVVEVKSGDRLAFGEREVTVEEEGGTVRLNDGARTWDLATGENRIGRQPGLAVTIEHPSVSREHAAILVVPGRIRFRDLGATNGSFVNGQRVGERELVSGDKIQLGETAELVFSSSAPAAPAAAPAAPAEIRLVVDGDARTLPDGEHKIGRAPDCSIVLSDDPGVSRYHAQIDVAGGTATLKDLGSANGTRLNGSAVTAGATLANGDRVGVGKRELAVEVLGAIDPLGKTVIASNVGELLGSTVLMSKDDLPPMPSGGVSGSPPAPQASGPRAAAAELLGVAENASPVEVRDRYQELFSEFQVRLTNAPTPELKQTYEGNLAKLTEAFTLLAPGLAGDLPSVKPVPVQPSSARAVKPPIEPAAPAAPSAPPPPVEPAVPEPPAADAEPASAAAPKMKAKAKKPKGEPTGRRAIPISAVIMAAFAVLGAIGIVVATMLSMAANAEVTELVDRRDELEADIARMRQEIAESTTTLEVLQVDTEPLLENGSLKICNLSTRDLRVRFLAASYVEDEELKIYRSSDSGKSWTIAPGGTQKFEVFAGDSIVWDGSVLFFSALFEYRGQEVWVTEAWRSVEGDCYPFAFDQ